jgi:hypothetical protein
VTYKQIQILGSNTGTCGITAKVEETIEYFGENQPYVLGSSITGPNTVIIFNEHFIATLREALSTNCTAKMSGVEESLFFDYIDYCNGNVIVDISASIYDRVLVAVDQWVYNEVRCQPQPELNACYDAVHNWEECAKVLEPSDLLN